MDTGCIHSEYRTARHGNLAIRPHRELISVSLALLLVYYVASASVMLCKGGRAFLGDGSENRVVQGNVALLARKTGDIVLFAKRRY